MNSRGERLRAALATPGGVSVAPVYDPLSARIAGLQGWEVAKISGSVGKAANLGMPDGVPMANASDLVDLVRRVVRVADLAIVVDADDGGSALTLRRTVQELEAAGVAGLELEDNTVPQRFSGERHSLFIGVDEQVARLRAARAARTDPATVIIGRTSALALRPLPEAIEMLEAYAGAGIDAICLPGQGPHGLAPDPKAAVEAVAAVTGLPLCISGLPADLRADHDWLARNKVALLFNPQVAYRAAVKAIHDGLAHLRAGGDGNDLADRWAGGDLLRAVTRTPELEEWDAEFGFGDA
jgi:carboxyvinyl-carboxyphosphonate phosphorylmutase